MMYKSFSVKTLLLLGFVASSSVYASSTISLGYLYLKPNIGDTNLNGPSVDYRYELDNVWGVLGSFSYAHGKKSNNRDGKTFKVDHKAYSFLVGPTYRLNENISFFGKLGITNIKSKLTVNDDKTSTVSSGSKNGPAWGLGLIVNPQENISLTVGYEGTYIKHEKENLRFNGFNLGVGYRF